MEAIALGGLLLGGYSMYSASHERARERERQEAAMQRAYEANKQDYKRTNRAIDKQIRYWERMKERPGQMHPEFSEYKRNIERQASSQLDQLKDVLRRQGRTGGAAVEAEENIREGVSQNIADTLMQISKQAQQNIHQLELARPDKPYLGAPRMDYAMPGQQQPLDLSGFGQAYALMEANKEKPEVVEDQSKVSTRERTGTMEGAGLPSDMYGGATLDDMLRMIGA